MAILASETASATDRRQRTSAGRVEGIVAAPPPPPSGRTGVASIDDPALGELVLGMVVDRLSPD
jgi:hypothetical protein